MSKVTVYISSVSSNLETKKKQKRVSDVLGNNYRGCEIEYVDISTSEDLKNRMRDIAGDKKALPPQFSKGGQYLGDYLAFDNAVEDEDIKGFLRC